MTVTQTEQEWRSQRGVVQILAQNLKHSSKSRVGWRRELNLDDSYANWARMALSPRRGANSIRFGGKKGGRERGREGARGEGEGKEDIKFVITFFANHHYLRFRCLFLSALKPSAGAPEITDTSADLLKHVKNIIFKLFRKSA